MMMSGNGITFQSIGFRAKNMPASNQYVIAHQMNRPMWLLAKSRAHGIY